MKPRIAASKTTDLSINLLLSDHHHPFFPHPSLLTFSLSSERIIAIDV